MVKTAIIALLTLLGLLLFKANIDTFRGASSSHETELVQAPKGGSKKISPQPPLNLNPTKHPQLPDLSAGYLFSAERFLAKDARQSKMGKGYGQNIRMEDVFFSGAILGEGYKKAIVSYTLGQQPTNRAIRPGSNTRTQHASRPESVQLEVGDQLGGYTVKEITSDFISFMKGSDIIQKTLFDPDKKRPLLTPRPPTAPQPKKRTPAIAPSRRAQPSSAKKP